MKWSVEYDNDANDDGGFREWWNVTNGARSFKCASEDDANWLADTLNRAAAAMAKE